jgi:hypothetical protein
MIEWTVGLKTGTEPQSGCTIDGKLTGNVLRCSSGSFLKSTLHVFYYGNSVRMMMGMNQIMFVFLSEGASLFPALPLPAFW